MTWLSGISLACSIVLLAEAVVCAREGLRSSALVFTIMGVVSSVTTVLYLFNKEM